MPTLNVVSTILAYGDTTVNSNPKYRFVDWTRAVQGITVAHPKNEQFIIDPSSSLSIFSGQRTTSIDATTAFSITQSPLDPSRYRFTNSAGTAPAFRTDRGASLLGLATTITSNVNATATIVSASGAPFASVVVGDTFFISGSTTGDAAGVFNVLNQGYWTVIGKASSTSLTLARPAGIIFTAVSETVTPSTINNYCFSSAGVQIGDSVEISAGFAANSLKTYSVVAVAATWFEVSSTSPIALETGILPGVAGMSFYKFSKKFVRVEVDQEAAIQANGDTGQTQRIVPIVSGDPDNMGWYDKFGPMWSLTVVNRSTTAMTVNIISVE